MGRAWLSTNPVAHGGPARRRARPVGRCGGRSGRGRAGPRRRRAPLRRRSCGTRDPACGTRTVRRTHVCARRPDCRYRSPPRLARSAPPARGGTPTGRRRVRRPVWTVVASPRRCGRGSGAPVRTPARLRYGRPRDRRAAVSRVDSLRGTSRVHPSTRLPSAGTPVAVADRLRTPSRGRRTHMRHPVHRCAGGTARHRRGPPGRRGGGGRA